MSYMNNRNGRASLAQETLKVIDQGFYHNQKGESQHLISLVSNAVEGTQYVKDSDFDELYPKRDKVIHGIEGSRTVFEVTSESTLEAAHRLIVDEEFKGVSCLNFASAKNPGGGFLGGSQAQEEALARSSALFPCISNNMEMYEYNRSRKTCLYSDHMQYSPDVPVFRHDDGSFLETPYLLNFITSPAVNAGALKGSEKKKLPEIMLRRTERVLTLAAVNRQKTLILGAWGCGVFKNNPDDIASYFASHLLGDGIFSRAFNRVVFAIYGRDPSNIESFKAYFDDSNS